MGFWEESSSVTKGAIVLGVVGGLALFIMFVWPGVMLPKGRETQRGVDMQRGVPAEQLIKGTTGGGGAAGGGGGR